MAAAIAIAAATMVGVVRRRHVGEVPRFVGAARCAPCHAKQAVAWSTSQHSLAMQRATPVTVLGDFDGARVTNAGQTTTLFRRGDRFIANTEGEDGTLRDYEIRYTFGVSPLQQYLVELTRGRLQPLQVAWDSRPKARGGQRWFHLTPGMRVAHTDEYHWTGRQQSWNYMCADCHSTGVRKQYDAVKDEFRTTWSDLNVGCEACHGPSSRHVSWAGSSSIARRWLWRDNGLAPMSRGAQQIETCAQCHSRREKIADGYTAGAAFLDFYVPSLLMSGLYHADGQQRAEVYDHASFLQSRMHRVGVTCINCHDPHAARLRKPGNQVCTQCHAPAKYDSAAHHFHRKGGAGASCAACHMPVATYMLIDRRHDHSIRVPRPDRSVAFGVPNACTDCHTDRDARWAAARVAAWYPTRTPGYQRFAEAFAADENGAPGAADALALVAADTSQSAIARASALARLAAHPGDIAIAAARGGATDTSALVRYGAMQILYDAPPGDRMRIATPTLSDTRRALRLEAAWVLAPVRADLRDAAVDAFDRAAREFIETQRYNADRPEAHLRLGIFLERLGRAEEAATEYRGAVRLSRTYSPGYVNLAQLLYTRGDDAGAERTLRAGLAATDDATLHHSLGLLLARQRRYDDALAELQRATSLDPAQAGFAYAYVVALNTLGRRADALRALERALADNPRDRDLLTLQQSFRAAPR